MNKKHLINQLILELKANHNTAITAAKRAHNTATDKANIAENKYDTLGLEAAYLAEGQSKRVMSLQEDLACFKNLDIKHYNEDMEIDLGALICLSSENTSSQYLFISPVAGGTVVPYQHINITLITLSSPLGRALKNSMLGDDIQLHSALYEIKAIW